MMKSCITILILIDTVDTCTFICTQCTVPNKYYNQACTFENISITEFDV